MAVTQNLLQALKRCRRFIYTPSLGIFVPTISGGDDVARTSPFRLQRIITINKSVVYLSGLLAIWTQTIQSNGMLFRCHQCSLQLISIALHDQVPRLVLMLR